MTLTWKARLADWAWGTISLTVSAATLVEALKLDGDFLADLEAVGQRLADVGDQLHAFGIEQRDQQLAGRDHIADVDLLIDHHALERRTDGGPIERGLHFIHRFARVLEIGIGGAQRGGGFLVILLGRGVGLEELLLALVVGGCLLAHGFGRRECRLGLLELGAQVGIVEAEEDVVGMHGLARLEIHLDDTREKLGADAGLVYGADRAHGRFHDRQLDRTRRDRLTLGNRRGGVWFMLKWDFGLELACQPEHEQDHAGRKPEQGGHAAQSAADRKQRRSSSRHGIAFLVGRLHSAVMAYGRAKGRGVTHQEAERHGGTPVGSRAEGDRLQRGQFGPGRSEPAGKGEKRKGAQAMKHASGLGILTVAWFLTGSSLALGAGKYFEVRYEPSQQPGELQMDATYTLWVPDGAEKLRAIIVHQHGCGAPACKGGATAAYDLHWQALAKKWNCALLGPSYGQLDKQNCALWSNPANGSGKTFLKALADLAAKAGRPELDRVPWCLWGHSGGGSWAGYMLMAHPERTVAVWFRSGAGMTRRDASGAQSQMPEAVCSVPMMCNPGVKEKGDAQFNRIWSGNLELFQTLRAKGAPIAVAPIRAPRTSAAIRVTWRFHSSTRVWRCGCRRREVPSRI